MKKKKSPEVSYVVPEGYYLPADKKAQKKRGKKLILMAVSIFLVSILLVGIFAPTLLRIIKLKTMLHGQEDAISMHPIAYDKGDIVLSGEVKTIEAGPFRFKVPKGTEEIMPKHPDERESSVAGFVYKENDITQFGITVDKINHNMQRDRDIDLLDELTSENDIPLDKEFFLNAFDKTLGYNPLSSWYLHKKAMFTLDDTTINWFDKSSIVTHTMVFFQKVMFLDGTQTVYQIETPDHIEFIQVMQLHGSKSKMMQIYLYRKADLDTQYSCVISCQADSTNAENLVFGIINSLELLPDAKERTDKFTEEYNHYLEKENAEREAQLAEADSAQVDSAA